MTHDTPPMTDIQAIARGLTKAQRRIVCELDDTQFADAYRHCRQTGTRMKLYDLGLTEVRRDGPVVSWWLIRLTPLGLAVRHYLENRHD